LTVPDLQPTVNSVARWRAAALTPPHHGQAVCCNTLVSGR